MNPAAPLITDQGNDGSELPEEQIQSLVSEVIANRSALDVMLGGNRADEGVETVGITPGGAATGDGQLSSTNDNWGAGAVVAGVNFDSTSGFENIRWQGDGFCRTTKTISAGIGLHVDFWNPTLAFGIDLKDYSLNRSVLLAGTTVYGADDTTALTWTTTHQQSKYLNFLWLRIQRRDWFGAFHSYNF